MKKLFFAITIYLLTVSMANAGQSRVKLFFHGHRDLNENVTLKAHIIPSGNNLSTGLAPLGYLELGINTFSWLNIGPAIGYDFLNDDYITSIRIKPSWNKVYNWTDLEYRPDSKGVYWFSQVEYEVLPWLHVGAEIESWGNYEFPDDISHGYGPNILFKMDKFALDLAWQSREYDNQQKTDFVARFHLMF